MKKIDIYEKKLNKNLNLSEKLKYVFIFVVIFSLIANAYCWFDFNFSHDSSAYIQNDGLWQVSIGRYLHPIYVFIRGKLFSPVIVGTLSMLWIGISTYFLTEIFNIKKASNVILTAGIMAANSVITYITATYIFELDVYMFSLMCSILAVYMALKKKKYWIVSIILFAISLGLYQSYWQVGIIVFMFVLIKQLLLKENYKVVLKNGIKYILILISSIILYMIGYKLFLLYFNLQAANTYNGLSNLGKIDISTILSLVKNTYSYYLYNTFNLHTYNSHIVNFFVLIGSICSLIYIITKMYTNKIKVNEIIMTLLLIILIPLGGNVIYIITQGMEHELMTYSFFILFIFYLVLWESTRTQYKNFDTIYGVIISVMCGVIIFSNTIYSNQIYMKKHTEFSYTYSLLSSVIEKVESMDNYVVGQTPVLFIGTFDNSKYNVKKDYYDYSAAGIGSSFSVTYESTYKSFINYVMSYPMNIIIDNDMLQEYKAKEEVMNMNPYPSKDSIKVIDGMVIVKLSD